MTYRTIAIITVLILSASCSIMDTEDILQYVDPFIGTDGSGQTYPGASLPFGMVQLSPDTRNDATQKACGGYHYSDSSILGFSHTHLSGVGQVDYTDILFMPVSGKVSFNTGTAEDPDLGYRSRFSHSDEEAYPGYYSVILKDYNIKAELTSTMRAGMHRYTFPANTESNIIIDLKHKESIIESVLDSYIEIVNDSTIEGYRRSHGVMAFDHTFYFRAEFSKPFISHKISLNENPDAGADKAQGKNIKASLSFNTEDNKQILVRVGISAVDMEGARKNLKSEITDWDFNAIVKNAGEIWNDVLNKIEIESKSEEIKRVFYTSMYHAYLAPQLFMDVDGRYIGANNKIFTSEGFVNYTALSLWDTFRAWHPMITIIDPGVTTDIINTLLKWYDETGRLPMWPLTGMTPDGMLGFHATSVITDAWVKGIRDFDIEKAYRAMKETMDSDVYGLDLYKAYGYIPCELEGESVSKTLEYSYNDWCVARLAKELGKDEDYKRFNARAHNYKNVFNPETKLMRGKKANGDWFAPFNPFVNSNYSEGNAWQYTFVPHDTKGLIEINGGMEEFDAWLDTFFTIKNPDTNRYDHGDNIGQYVHGNEPDHHMAYLYNYTGNAWKTQSMVRRILSEQYDDTPNGLAGNEDCGQMSAWYILSSLGFYSFNPGEDIYLLGSPIVESAVINTGKGKRFGIKTQNQCKENIYIQSVELNGKEYTRSYIKHKDIVSGGELLFVLGPEPNKTWAAKKADIPPTDNAKATAPVPGIKTDSRPSQMMEAAEVSRLIPGLSYKYYEAAYSNIGQIESFEAVKSGIVPCISSKNRQREKYFAYIFKGYIKIPHNDIYTFYLESNDGSKLYLDGVQIIDNDNYHGVKEVPGQVALEAGFHKMELKYFQAGGSHALKLYWESDIIKKQEVPTGNLYHRND